MSRKSASVSWKELLPETVSKLEGDNAEIEAKWMIEEVSGITEESDYREKAKPAQLDRLNRLIERRLAGEPLQYVLGRWQFRELDLFVDRRVLIPRPETEVMVGYVIEECKSKKAKFGVETVLNVADLGCAECYTTHNTGYFKSDVSARKKTFTLGYRYSKFIGIDS